MTKPKTKPISNDRIDTLASALNTKVCDMIVKHVTLCRGTEADEVRLRDAMLGQLTTNSYWSLPEHNADVAAVIREVVKYPLMPGLAVKKLLEAISDNKQAADEPGYFTWQVTTNEPFRLYGDKDEVPTNTFSVVADNLQDATRMATALLKEQKCDVAIIAIAIQYRD